jgi:beta-galactosidase
MRVDTVSERLSYASGYAFHNLGGIDRSVRVYALPKTHIREMHIDAGLDGKFRDGVLKLRARVDGGDGQTLRLRISGTDGKAVEHSVPGAAVRDGVAEITSRVPSPLKWSAEKPNLYTLAIELLQGGRALERIERKIGFRKIEVKGSLLYVNGVVI